MRFGKKLRCVRWCMYDLMFASLAVILVGVGIAVGTLIGAYDGGILARKLIGYAFPVFITMFVPLMIGLIYKARKNKREREFNREPSVIIVNIPSSNREDEQSGTETVDDNDDDEGEDADADSDEDNSIDEDVGGDEDEDKADKDDEVSEDKPYTEDRA